MLDRVITHAVLLEIIDALGRERRLIGPVARTVPDAHPPQRYFYTAVSRAAELALDFSYTVYGLKPFLFPARETLFTYHRAQRRFTARPSFDARPQALVGVHPCDLHALGTLDAVFGRPPRDEHYLARRAATFVIGLDCPHPCAEDVFCRDMETNHADAGFDLMLYPLARGDHGRFSGDRATHDVAVHLYGVVFGSSAGRALLLGQPPCGRDPTQSDQQRFLEYLAHKEELFPRALHTAAADLPRLMDRSYDSLVWPATAQRCYSCASCNLVCPTCYCFDTQDVPDLSLSGGRMERCWDGCMAPDFAVTAGPHNFRPHASQRLRHRIFRKAAWIQQTTGHPGCVGCARCDRACTARISIREILNQLAETPPRGGEPG